MDPFGVCDRSLPCVDGTLAEHRGRREAAVVFDASHLGSVRVSGPAAHASLQRTLTNDLDKVGPGRAQYTHLLDDADASVADDIIVWWVDDETFEVMPNRSEEHTSELQSLMRISYAVFCLKKKKQQQRTQPAQQRAQ